MLQECEHPWKLKFSDPPWGSMRNCDSETVSIWGVILVGQTRDCNSTRSSTWIVFFAWLVRDLIEMFATRPAKHTHNCGKWFQIICKALTECFQGLLSRSVKTVNMHVLSRTKFRFNIFDTGDRRNGITEWYLVGIKWIRKMRPKSGKKICVPDNFFARQPYLAQLIWFPTTPSLSGT